MRRRDFLGGIAASALIAGAGFGGFTMAPAMAAPLEEFAPYACERCSGMGWIRHGSNYPDCPLCDGTGQMTKDQVEAYWDRDRG